MTEELRPYGLGLSTTAVEKRRQQLEAWRNSSTNLESGHVSYRHTSKVKFSKGVMLLAAVSNGDEKEVERLVNEDHANVNYKNSDGLTAVHQCCIDDDIEMLKVLVRCGANINTCDNEGWTPLHAAASCGYDHIVRYLLDCGSFPAAVNNEGQTPSDLGEDYPEIVDMIETEIQNQGIDVDEVKCEEEKVMLEDARKMLNDPNIDPVVSNGGATPLHVAAAKNYTTVLNVLLSIVGQDIDPRDDDGWTPLHAAVYWGSVEAAELLLLSGANMYHKTDVGEGFDDLIDPDLEEEFVKLKKLNTYINPEQEPRKRIRHQVIRQRSLNMNSNAQNNMDSKNTGGITSPGVKRRLSKERVNSSKMLDMKKEKEDLFLSFEKVPEEPSEGGSTSNTRDDTNTSPLPPPSSSHQTSDNMSEGYSTHNHVTEDNTTTDDFPEPHHHRSGSLTGSGSPKNARRKGEMSQKMLQRLNMFETTGPSSGGGGSSSQGTMPSSPRTSTPVNSPMVQGGDDRKKVDTCEGGVSSRPKSASLDKGQPSSSSTTPPLKRFSFQPKPISSSGTSTSKGPPKSMSLDRGDSSFLKSSLDKMMSQDRHSRSTKFSLDQGKSFDIAKPFEREKILEKIKPVEDVKKEKEKPVEQALTTPTEKTVNESSLMATPEAKLGDTSTDSNASLMSKDRSNSSLQPEAKRKTTARKARETRRSTQPVPTDLLQRIKQSDEVEEKELEDSIGGTVKHETSLHSEEKKSNDDDSVKDQDKDPKQQTNVVEAVKSPTVEVNSIDTMATTKSGALQSAYKPASRPASKILSDDDLQPSVVISEVLSTSPSTNVDQSQPTAGNSHNLSPSVPRSRSTTRRKKIKEKRRSTGIAEPEENEEIPDNLKSIFHRHQGSSDSTDSSVGQNTNSSSLTDSVHGVDESSLSTAAIEYYQQEIDKLRQLLSEEKEKTKVALQSHKEVCAQLELKNQQLVELQKKYENTNKAYELEKSQREDNDKQVQNLSKSDKTIAELKNEIQRLRDENGALIRVVGKLSRAPFPS